MKTVTTKKRLVLLDAHAILHRAYHALPDFATSHGKPTGALYGISSMLIKIITDLKPDYIAACYDLPQPTYRHEAYSGYKAQRKKPDENLVSQMKSSREIFKVFNIPIYEMPGFEADDILGTIVEQVKDIKGLEVIIASGDMDTMQLADDERVKIYTLKKGFNDIIMYDEKAMRERFGFAPKLLPDYKGLRGDPSDNIIGIAGIGEKTATDIIKNFGGIEDIYKKLKKDEKAFIEAGIKSRVIELLKDGEEEARFSKMLAVIRRDAPIKFEIPEKSWSDGLDIEKIEALFFELEFKTLGARVREAFGAVKDRSQKSDENKDEVPEKIHNQELEETAVALWVVDSNFTDPSLDDILRFAKTKYFAEAKKIIFAELKKRECVNIFEDIERPLIPIIKKMFDRGVKIDKNYLQKLSKEYHHELAAIEKKIFKEAGEEFNINSPKQLSEILFEKMKLVVKNHKKTEGGVMSTRESELVKMRGQNPVIDNILAYRELQKLLSTYIDNIPVMVADDGRLRARFLQTGTTTGRMSSQNPNLQNIPVKTEYGKNIRRAFVSENGFELAAFDYSQIELRIAAVLSGDENLLEVFRSGIDVHSAVASKVFGVPLENVDREMRRKAKVINFGILYGMGVNALRENLGTTRVEAQKFYNDYFATFSGLADYLNKVKSEAERKGYTTTYFGRRRYFEGLKSKISYIKASAERMAINAPLQGTQADIIKIAMARIDKYITEKHLENDVFLLLQVHDELIYEIKEDLIDKVGKEIKKIMESVLDPRETRGVTFFASSSFGKNWGQMEKVGEN